MDQLKVLEDKIDFLIEGQKTANKVLLNSTEVKELYGLSEHVLRKARKEHGLKHVLIDHKKIMYRREDIEALIDKCTV